MEFNLTDEQILLQKTVKEFTQGEIEPRAGQIDKEGKLPDDLIKSMAEINLHGMVLPREFGGGDASTVDCVLAIEQISYSGTGSWMLVGFTNSIPECILKFGSENQKKKFLKPVCEGSVYPSIQFTEANTGSDPGALDTKAVPAGDNYVINGMKRFSTFGARDGFAVLYARDETGKCSAFIIEKNVGGYSTGINYDLMGGGGIEATDVYLTNLNVPEENILGTKGNGSKILFHWIADEKIQQCGACVGIAQAALDESIKFSRSRMIRGKPQSSLLTIRSMLADMHAKLQAARWLTYRSAFLKDNGSPNWITEAASTKIFVAPAAMEIVETARQIHGAYGYTKEFKIERLYRAIAGASAIAVSLDINRVIVSSALIK